MTPSSQMSDQYYVLLGEEAVGPLSKEQLFSMQSDRRVTEKTLICRVGDSEWKPMGEVFPSTEPVRPPAPPPVPPLSSKRSQLSGTQRNRGIRRVDSQRDHRLTTSELIHCELATGKVEIPQNYPTLLRLPRRQSIRNHVRHLCHRNCRCRLFCRRRGNECPPQNAVIFTTAMGLVGAIVCFNVGGRQRKAWQAENKRYDYAFTREKKRVENILNLVHPRHPMRVADDVEKRCGKIRHDSENSPPLTSPARLLPPAGTKRKSG